MPTTARRADGRPKHQEMFLAQQVPAGKEGVWGDSNGRESAWESVGGKILRWEPSCSPEDWYDPFHPKAKEAIRFVSQALRNGGVSVRVLIGGDITSAY